MNSIVTICVHYKNISQTQEFINNHCFERSDLIVVDNSLDMPSMNLTSTFECIRPTHNLGYFGAVQFAYEKIKDRGFKNIIVANSDLKLEADFFEKITREKYPDDVGVIAPYIYSSISENNINPLYINPPSYKKLKLIRWVFELYLLGVFWQVLGYVKGLNGSGVNKGQSCSSSEKIFAPHGCLMIFTSSYFKAGLDFSYPIFLYGEELWVGFNCAKKNLTIQTDWNLKATHFEHGSLGIWPSYRVWKAHRDSNRYLLKMFKNYKS